MNKARHRIFAIDDESEILENYQDLLGDAYELTTFQDPTSFLRYFDDSNAPRPSLIITDLNLPAMTGLEMITKLQKKGENYPFILLSGYLNKDNVIQAVDAGVFRLLEKPVESKILYSAIDQLILEHEIVGIRSEIRSLTAQLRELYTGIRLVMEQYIPDEVMKRMIVEAPNGIIKKQMGFDDLLENLEGRLETLLNNEKLLTEMKVNQFRAEK